MRHHERTHAEPQLSAREFAEKFQEIKEQLARMGCKVSQGGYRIGTSERYEITVFLKVPDAQIAAVETILSGSGLTEYTQSPKALSLPLAHTVMVVSAVFPDRVDKFITELRSNTTFEFPVGDGWTDEYSEMIATSVVQ